MPTLSQIKVGNTTYDICDTEARNSISQINNLLTTFETITDSSELISSTPSSSRVDLIRINRWAYLGLLYVRSVYSAQMTTQTLITTLKNKYWPLQETGGETGSGKDTCFLSPGGELKYAPSATVAANTTIYLKVMYIMSNYFN